MAAPMDLSKYALLTGNSLHFKRKQAYKSGTFDPIREISYTDFFQHYLFPNKPCIFSSDVTVPCRSRTSWVTDDGGPNFEYLRHCFGDATVPVANCKQEQYSSHPKHDMTMADYLLYWQEYIAGGYKAEKECLYLKDWHFTKAFPDYKAYETPVYFQSDWLNEFWDTQPRDDYRFVYMGPKGTWTPFHADVYRSFSWSANICGRKRWIFYPQGCEENLKDKFGQLIYNIESPELNDPGKYPNGAKVEGQRLEVIQERGEMIFVPSGWHHQVYNLEDTISINHNWLNGCNIDICWNHLQDNLTSVKREIDDCKNMEGWAQQCQLILDASAGINYKTFVHMLKVITENRIKSFEQFTQDDTSIENIEHEHLKERKEDVCEDVDVCGKVEHVSLIEKPCDGSRKVNGLSIAEHDSETISDFVNDAKPEPIGETGSDGFENRSDTKSELSNKGLVMVGSDIDKNNSESRRFDFEICDKQHAQLKVGDCLVNNLEKRVIDKSDRTRKLSPNCHKTVSISNELFGSKSYIIYDLLRLKEVVTDIMDDDDYKQADDLDGAKHIIELIKQVVPD